MERRLADLDPRYEGHEELGRGGMGVVFRATDRASGRPVAVKLLSPAGGVDSDLERRFLDEARLACRVRHPAVVQVLAADCTPGGSAYIVYELVEGADLQAILERSGALPPATVHALGVQLMQGLAAIHEAGIVHRDIKPANLRCSAGGELKIIDFGIARDAFSERARTQTGVLLGTPEFIAPELIRGERATAASDLYAAGATLFALATGAPPFQANALAQVFEAHLNAPPPDAAERAPGVPPAFARLVAAMLAKEPALRPSTAQVERALAECGEHATTPHAATIPAPRRGSRTVRAAPADVALSRTRRDLRSESACSGPAAAAGPETRRARRGPAWMLILALAAAGLVALARRPAREDLKRPSTPAETSPGPASRGPPRSLADAESLLDELAVSSVRFENSKEAARARGSYYARALAVLLDLDDGHARTPAGAARSLAGSAALLLAALSIADAGLVDDRDSAALHGAREVVTRLRDRRGLDAVGRAPAPIPPGLSADLSELERVIERVAVSRSVEGALATAPSQLDLLHRAVTGLSRLTWVPEWGDQDRPGSFARRFDAVLQLITEWILDDEVRGAMHHKLACFVQSMERCAGDAPDYWQCRTSGTLFGAPESQDPALVIRYPAELLASAAPEPQALHVAWLIEALGRVHLASRTLKLAPGGDPELLRRWSQDRLAVLAPLTQVIGTSALQFEHVGTLGELAADLGRLKSGRSASRPRLLPLLGLAVADFGLRLMAERERSHSEVTRAPDLARANGRFSEARASRHVMRFQLLLRLVDLGTLVPERRPSALEADRRQLVQHSRMMFYEMRKDPLIYTDRMWRWLGHSSPEGTLAVVEGAAAVHPRLSGAETAPVSPGASAGSR